MLAFASASVHLETPKNLESEKKKFVGSWVESKDAFFYIFTVAFILSLAPAGSRALTPLE